MKNYQSFALIAFAAIFSTTPTQASILSYAMLGFPAAAPQAKAAYIPTTSNAPVLKWGYQGKFLDQNQYRAPASLAAPPAAVVQQPLPISAQTVSTPSAPAGTVVMPTNMVAPLAPVATAAVATTQDQNNRSMVTVPGQSSGQPSGRFAVVPAPQYVPLPITPTVVPVDHSLHFPFKRPIQQYGSPAPAYNGLMNAQ